METAPEQNRPLMVDSKSVTNCMSCEVSFTLTVRRHHCRVCGQVFCNKCCGTKLHIPSLGYKKPQRICTKCREKAPELVGKPVRVLQCVTTVRDACANTTSLPPWNFRKAAFCGSLGVVTAQDHRDGTCRVQFTNGPFSWFPPSALTFATDAELAEQLGDQPLPTSDKSTVKVKEEDRIVLTSTVRPQIEGCYTRTGEILNNMPVWAMGPCRLYSNASRRWVLTSSEDGMRKEQGGVQSAVDHCQKLPHLIKEWEIFREGKWCIDPSFQIAKAKVPHGSLPTTNTFLTPTSAVQSVTTQLQNPSSVPAGRQDMQRQMSRPPADDGVVEVADCEAANVTSGSPRSEASDASGGERRECFGDTEEVDGTAHLL
eukprot:Sspe_Gene.90366::Locus_61931_Transcript_1_1_Confidence_1.000_Length_1162::g.90366::m.90366